MSSPAVSGGRANLWVAVDNGGMEKLPTRWDYVGLSTIHSTYYNYYQNYVL
jgi:hypothetical protein